MINFVAVCSLVFNFAYASRFDSICRSYRIASQPLRKKQPAADVTCYKNNIYKSQCTMIALWTRERADELPALSLEIGNDRVERFGWFGWLLFA
jgi:hypothetical protein